MLSSKCVVKVLGLILAIGSTSCLTALAQPDHAEAAKVSEALIKTRLAEARALLEQGKDEAAEARLGQDSTRRAKSVEGFQEKAADFLRIAFSAKEAGDIQTAQKAAKHALVQLENAEKVATNDNSLAEISEFRGVIFERLLGDTTQAVREYKKALERKPDASSARQKLRRIDTEASAKSPEASK